MRKKVTVAIPVFNMEKWIPITLQSILDQSITIDQILICDNQSTDNTIPIVKEFINNNKDSNIRLHINEVNLGAYGNLNKCFDLCTTDFLLNIDADDSLKPDAIEKLLAVYEQYPDIAFVGGQHDYMDEDGNLLAKTPRKKDMIFQRGELLEFYTKVGVFFHPGTILYNMKYREEFYFDTKEIGGDEKQYVTILLKHPIIVLGDTIINQRVHLGQTGTREYLRYNDRIEYYERSLSFANFESSPERIKKARKYLKNWLAAQVIVVSKSVWRDFGEKKMGIKYWIYGMKKNPYYYLKKYISGPVKTQIKRVLNR